MTTASVILAPSRTVSLVLSGANGTLSLGAGQGISLALDPIFKGTKGDKGDPGPGAGPIQTLIGVAGAALSGHRVVGMDATGRYTYIDSGTSLDGLRLAGITTGAADLNAPVTVQTGGPMTESSWNWTPSGPLYVGANGLLTQTPPQRPASVFAEIVGFAWSATTVFIRLQPAITLS